MKKLFIDSFVRIYGASKRKARRAWKAYDESMRLAIIASI